LLSLLHSVAGTIAAKHNDIGVVGVAPGATVIPVKVLNKSSLGTISGVIRGVDYVGANGEAGDVANMSLGGGPSDALDNAVVAAANMGIYFTLSAGNSGQDASNYSPARASGTNVFTISAIDNTGTFASFSNFGNPPVDYAAPGVNVYSTYKNGGYATYSGTSMAAPHAAGVLLMTNGQPNTCGTVKNDKDSTADPIICL
jgi:subtilisin family serine protease